MPKKGAIAFMLMLTGLTGYLLFDSMGIMGGFLTAGLFYMGLGLKHFAGVRLAEGKAGGKRIRFHHGRQRRQAEVLEKKARLEALRARAYLLADACRDSYGAQRCCLEIIGLTEKEDPLFMEACELYMHTVSTQSQRVRASRPPGTSNGSQLGVKQAPATGNVIPFPLTAGPI
jgi:hypothetical protein